MNIIILGAPGSGKGTQGARLAGKLGIPKIATGDLLREAVKAQSELGVMAANYMNQGLLVPDDVIIGLIREILDAPQARNGIIMDGFPRTVHQAEAVDNLLAENGRTVDQVLYFDVPADELVERMHKRAVEEGRSDDTPETIRRRLSVYEEQTLPLREFYEKRGLLTSVEATGTIDEVEKRVHEALKQ